MAPVPVTRCVIAMWDRPRYELLDARSAVIARLAEVAHVAGFTPAHDSLDVDLANGVNVNVDLGQVIVTDTTGSESSSCRPAVEAVADVLGASRVGLRILLQYVVEWPGHENAIAAQSQAGTSVLGLEGVTDFATLFDGEQGQEWTYQAEYGVVAASEVPTRLARLMGRVLGPRGNIVSGEVDYPPVATFVDCVWKLRRPTDVASDECWQLVTQVDEHAARLVDALHTRLTS